MALESRYKAVGKTSVEGGGDGLLVEALTYEDELLHAVAIGFVPVAAQPFLACFERFELGLGHGGVPLAGIAQAHLSARLLKYVAGLGLVLEPAYSLTADNALRELAGHELIEPRKVERTPTVIHESADTILLGLALFMVMMVMVVAVFVVMFVVIVVVMMVGVVMVVVVFLLFVVVVMVLYLVNPCGRSGCLVEIEAMGVEEQVELYVAVVTFYDVGLGLDGLDDVANTGQLIG